MISCDIVGEACRDSLDFLVALIPCSRDVVVDAVVGVDEKNLAEDDIGVATEGSSIR